METTEYVYISHHQLDDQWIFLDPCHRVWQDFIHELSDCDLSDFTGVKVLVGHLFV